MRRLNFAAQLLVAVVTLQHFGANALSAANLMQLRSFKNNGGQQLLRSQTALQRGSSPEFFRSATGWCRLIPIEQVLNEDGCQPRSILNHFCAGQCTSYYLPRTLPDSRPTDNGPHCKTCQARKVKWRAVSLTCRNATRKRQKKMVEFVLGCACEPCSAEGITGKAPAQPELPTEISTPPATSKKPKRKKKKKRKKGKKNKKNNSKSTTVRATAQRTINSTAATLTRTTSSR